MEERNRPFRSLPIPITCTRSAMTARFFSVRPKVRGSNRGQSLTQRRRAALLPRPRLRSGSRSSPPSTGWTQATVVNRPEVC